MHLPLLLSLLLAGPPTIAPAQDQDASLENIQMSSERAVALSLIPAITRTENPRAAELQWIFAVPHEVRSSLVNGLPATDKEGRAARDAALMLILKRDQVANFRARAASGLSPNHSQQTRDALVAALKDADHSVRLMACQSLMHSDDHSVAKSVLPLLDDRHVHTRYVAARTLGWLEAKEALPALRTLYDNSDPKSNEVVNLAEAFSRLGDEAMALKAIAPLLDSENWNIRHFVHRSLRRVKSKQVVPLLIGTLETEMRRELNENRQHSFRLPTRTMRGVCDLLDERTGEKIGVDPQGWIDWWSRHATEYGVQAADGPSGKEFNELCVRYSLVIKHGHEPELPEQFTGRVRLAKADGVAGEEKTTTWSGTVDGVRLRLLAPAEISRSGNSRLNVLVQNRTDKALVMPPFSLPSAIDYEQGSKRYGERANSQTHWSLPPHGSMLLSITFKPRSGIQLERETPKPSAIIEETIELPTSVGAGRYELVFTLDSAPASDSRKQIAVQGASIWQGKLVSPPVVVQLADKHSDE